MPAEKISIEKAHQDKLFYFVANVVVYREEDQKCLILKRSDSEKAHPGKYAVPGGKLEWKDLDMTKPTRVNGDILDFEYAVENLLMRETEEEAGIKLQPKMKYINSLAFIRPDGIPVVLVKFAAKYRSGEVKLEEGAFTDYAWVSAEEVMNYDCIKGIQDEVIRTIDLFIGLK
jgi:8-oxo-dGTP pyrophosphatase MutT (NUDIX family)